MSWDDAISLHALSQNQRSAALMISANAGGGLRKPGISVISNIGLLQDLSWWRPGLGVRAQVGNNEHAGLLRFTPKGQIILKQRGGKYPANTSIVAVLACFPGMEATTKKAVAVEYDYNNDWLELTLPQWACVGAKQTQVYSVPERVQSKLGRT
ncbi:MAG: hypothetical protein ACRYHQ_20135 [Janthinobacterium lividum]